MTTEKENFYCDAITLPFEKISTIFQIGNPNIYELADRSPNSLQFVSQLGLILSSLDIKDGDSLQIGSTNAAENVKCLYITKENGAFFAATTYQLPLGGNDSENRFSLIMAQAYFDEEKNEMPIQPHFVLVGTMIGTNIIVQASYSLAEIKDAGEIQNILLGYTNPDEFYSSLCYADAAFRTVMSGFALDHTDNQYWLTKDGRPLVSDRFNRISQRDSRQLTEELIKGHQAIPDNAFASEDNSFSLSANRGPGFYLN